MTLGEALAAGTNLLEIEHTPAARLHAEVLLAYCLGVERSFLLTHPNDNLPLPTQRSYEAALERRRLREPLQYITGAQEFYGRRFAVDPSVLIPRPETEFVVETVSRLNRWEHPYIVDVGTGSGCIAVTLALEIPNAEVFAGDLSIAPLKTARSNARTLGARVRLACVDSLGAWSSGFHFVVSNPPYVSDSEKKELQPEVRDHEPHLALFGAQKPVHFYRTLIAEAYGCLIRNGYIVLEIGYTMEDTVLRMFDRGWELETTTADLQGIPRVVAARKR